MVFGIFGIYAAMAAGAFSAWNYYLAAKLESQYKQRPNNANDYLNKINLARQSYYLLAFIVSIVSVYLWYLIFTHQFQVDYIYRYTSVNLGIGYLFSAFWAGQEGSFLFWALMISLMGLLYMRKTDQYVSYAMIFLNVVLIAFFLLIAKASPFSLSGQFPADGAGLNPLLHNPWMVIHPPVLFLGYASVTFPFCVALSALVLNDFEDWAEKTYPWVLFTSVSLGAGIIIGAYWAYQVLGWGGYWGWDPVENSSLIAWLVVMAFFHSLILTKKRGLLQKTSLFLSILSFVLVVYATFLTRSGVLADFSVHSFQDMGINNYLIIYMLAALFAGTWLIVKNNKQIPAVAADLSAPNKVLLLIITVAVLVVSAFLIFLGTSSPIITSLISSPSQVAVQFYNDVNLPLAILMALLLSFAPFLSWENMNIRKIQWPLIISAILGISAAVISVWFGLNDLQSILFVGFATSAFMSNLLMFIAKIKTGQRVVAAYLAHIGVGMTFVAILISGSFEESQQVVVSKDKPGHVLGYKMTYSSDYVSPDGKNGVLLNVSNTNESFTGIPRLYQNNFTKSLMREPFVKNGLITDLYISPIQTIMEPRLNSNKTLTLTQGETQEIGGYDYHFKGFKLENHENQSGMIVYALLSLSKEGETVDFQPSISQTGNRRVTEPVIIPALSKDKTHPKKATIQAINANTKSVQLLIEQQNGANVEKESRGILFEVSKKPFMSVLWLGSILLSLGTLIAIKKSIVL